MSGIAVAERRREKRLSELSDEVSDVESAVDAICELLQLAGSGVVHASSIYVLLRPLQARLSAAAGSLSDLSG